MSLTLENLSREVDGVDYIFIDRQDFEITYPGKPDDLIQDNVVLTLSFVAPRS